MANRSESLDCGRLGAWLETRNQQSNAGEAQHSERQSYSAREAKSFRGRCMKKATVTVLLAMLLVVGLLIIWKRPAPLQALNLPQVGQGDNTLRVSGVRGALVFEVEGVNLFDAVPLNSQETAEQSADRVFDFVSREIVVWENPSGHDLGDALYGYGFGLCKRESGILLALWRRHGIKGRLVSWPKHVMSEAYLDGHWQVFDAQHRLNYSKFMKKPVCFEDLAQAETLQGSGLDPIGYGHGYLRDLFALASVDKEPKRDTYDSPGLKLDANQTLWIRPRSSIATHDLPLPEKDRETRDRTHLIPLYELVLEHRFGSGEAHLSTGLPLLGLDWEGGSDLQARLPFGRAIKDFEQLKGRSKTVIFRMDEGARLEVAYALANWVGERLFRALAQDRLKLKTSHGQGVVQLSKTSAALIQISEFDISPPSQDGTRQLQVTLSWENMTAAEPQNYQLYLDVLSSDLTLEVWRYLQNWEWRWHPGKDGPRGQTHFSFPWKPEKTAGPYRPAHVRTLLAHVKGPGVVAGKNMLRRRIELD